MENSIPFASDFCVVDTVENLLRSSIWDEGPGLDENDIAVFRLDLIDLELLVVLDCFPFASGISRNRKQFLENNYVKLVIIGNDEKGYFLAWCR